MKITLLTLILVVVQVPTGISETFFRRESTPSELNGVFAMYISRNISNPIRLLGSKGAVYVSNEKNNKWERILKFNDPQAVSIRIELNELSSRALIVTSEGLYLSTSNLKKWKKIFGSDYEENMKIYDGTISKKIPEKILVASNNGLYVSESEGKSWQRFEIGLEQAVYEIHESQNGFWLTTENGIYELSEKDSKVTRQQMFNEKSIQEIESEGNAYGSIEYTTLQIPRRSWMSLDGNTSLFYLDSGSRPIEGQLFNSTIQISSPHSDSAVEPLTLDEDHIMRVRNNKLYLLNINSGEENYLPVTPGTGLIHDIDYHASADTLTLGAENGVYVYENYLASQVILSGVQPKTNNEYQMLGDLFKAEPSIREIQVVAMRYAEVHPEKIDRWRQQVSKSSWLPQVSIGFDHGVNQVVELDRGGTNDPDLFINGPDERDFNYDVQFTWSLAELIWNPDQTSIDNRSKLMVQLREELMSRVNTTYFARRQLILDDAVDIQSNPLKSAKRLLQIQELEAELDAMTGGYFSQKIHPNVTFSEQGS